MWISAYFGHLVCEVYRQWFGQFHRVLDNQNTNVILGTNWNSVVDFNAMGVQGNSSIALNAFTQEKAKATREKSTQLTKAN